MIGTPFASLVNEKMAGAGGSFAIVCDRNLLCPDYCEAERICHIKVVIGTLCASIIAGARSRSPMIFIGTPCAPFYL